MEAGRSEAIPEKDGLDVDEREEALGGNSAVNGRHTGPPAATIRRVGNGSTQDDTSGRYHRSDEQVNGQFGCSEAKWCFHPRSVLGCGDPTTLNLRTVRKRISERWTFQYMPGWTQHRSGQRDRMTSSEARASLTVNSKITGPLN